MQHKYIFKKDYDEKYQVSKDMKVFCYSKKQLKRLCENEGEYKLVGETRKANKKEEIAQLLIENNDPMIVSEVKSNSRILYREAAYICVGKDEYVILLKSRIPFLILLFGLGLGIGTAVFVLWNILVNPIIPTLQPDHPLPDEDPSVEIIEDDNTEQVESEEGGGSVSMIYTLEAKASLSNQKVEIYFRNPNASNHGVVLQLYVGSGENEVMLAESGLVNAGYGLYELELIPDVAILSEGVYDAFYKVLYYDTQTGEKALVESTITDVALTVTN